MEHTPKEKEQIRILSGVDFLESLPEKELAELITRNPESHFRPKEIFSTPYEEDDRIFVIKAGRVRIYKIGPEGHEQTLGELGDRTVLAAHRLHGSYGQALEPTTILALSEEELKRVFERNPEVALRLIRVLTRRLRLADERLADIALKEVSARVASLVLQLVEEEGIVTGEGYKIPTRYTHERLGTMIGAKRVAVNRAIRQLKEAAALELPDRYIHVRDMEALRRFAAAERGG
jgi:CRP/FNR family transcriptional regulator, cyclic AMP receptor protein